MQPSNRLFTLFALFGSLILSSLSFAATEENKYLDKALYIKDAMQSSSPKKSAQSEPACIRLSRGPGVALEEQNPGLHQLLADVMEHLSKRESKGFQSLFHPRVKVEHDIGERIFSILSHRYDQPWNFSVYRVWALHHPAKDRTNYSCDDDPGFTISSRYGYERQYAAWLQVMGKNELGRIFLAISPVEDRLWITGFHIQQWTHLEHDWEHWTRLGNEALEKKDQLQAYFHYDVAQKLLVGGDFVEFAARDKIIEQRDLLFTRESFTKNIQEVLKDSEVVYVATILSRDGTGLLVRERLKEVPSTHDLQKKCQEHGKALLAKGRLKGDGGIRCSFIVPGEEIDREGQLGGFYFTQKELGSELK